MKRTRPTWKTAIKRRQVSLPIRKHLMRELTDPCKRVLDYGCGRGYDADRLGMFKYDPHFSPEAPEGKFDYIYCGYVLNVLTQSEGRQIIKEIQSLLTPRGVAYVAVRRDMKPDNPNQRKVVLDGEVISYHDNSRYALYYFWSDSEVKVK
jgi:2-polyprenyl-3-methyl-5-hydroxy-6-metoxy-1,4-benzoquinol methylase